LWMPRATTVAPGMEGSLSTSSLATMGREQAAGVQAPRGAQTLFKVAQQPYPWRQVLSSTHCAAQSAVVPIWVQAPVAHVALVQSAVQYPPG
jgi:hypothetical protein